MEKKLSYSRLMGFSEVSKAVKKDNEQLKERIRDLEISNTSWAENFAQLKRNKDTVIHNLNEENANLKEQLSQQKEINKKQVDEHAELIKDYAHATDRIDGLEERCVQLLEIAKKEREEKVLYKSALEETKRELNNLKFAMKQYDRYYDILDRILSHENNRISY